MFGVCGFLGGFGFEACLWCSLKGFRISVYAGVRPARAFRAKGLVSFVGRFFIPRNLQILRTLWMFIFFHDFFGGLRVVEF